jgi:hypothetical protein
MSPKFWFELLTKFEEPSKHTNVLIDLMSTEGEIDEYLKQFYIRFFKANDKVMTLSLKSELENIMKLDDQEIEELFETVFGRISNENFEIFSKMDTIFKKRCFVFWALLTDRTQQSEIVE